MKKLIKRISIVILLFLLLIFAYYSFVVISARSETKNKFETFLNSEQTKVHISELSDFQLEALLKVEDPNFYNHNGFDITTPGAGLTTITQSIAKRFYFENFKPGIPKIKQTLIAVFAIDPLISKDDQLTVFINEYPFNSQAIGFSGAADYYYKKMFQELTDDEYLSIIAMFLSPEAFDIKKESKANQERVNNIQLLIKGEYTPINNLDLYYQQKRI